jgi:kynureninase
MNWQEAELEAKAMDIDDTLSKFRDDFSFPVQQNGFECTYLCGNSLGLMPNSSKERIQEELTAWQELAIGGHFRDVSPWKSYQESVSSSLARLVGAKVQEVVAMNALTVNLHLLLVSFFKPSKKRFKILIEESTFPSDRYALMSQLLFHGLDPQNALIEVSSCGDDLVIGDEALIEAIERAGESLSLVLLPGIQYLSGERFHLEKISKAAHRVGAIVGFDLAHAVGNVPLSLHDDQVDFAVWCHYKYVNAGPGAVGGAFIHEKHLANPSLNRFNGWWGNELSTRFLMEKRFRPYKSADAWQISNSPIFSMASLRGALELFDKTSIKELREKGDRMTAFCEKLLLKYLAHKVAIVSPSDLAKRGNQLSLNIQGNGQQMVAALKAKNIIVDFREPNIIRFACAPFYNRFQEVVCFVKALHDEALSAT